MSQDDPAADPSATPPPAGSLPSMPEAAVLMKEGNQRMVPDRRELEKSPSQLRVAAGVLCVGALLPWTGHGGGLFTLVIAKLVAALSVFLFYAAVLSRTKDGAPMGLGALAKPRWGKPFSHKTTGFVDSITHAVPTPLHVLALLALVASIVIAFLDPDLGTEGNGGFAAAEVGLLLVGGLTLVHVYAYQRGGHFSPLYPFMFLAPIMLGAPRLAAYMGDKPWPVLKVLGAATCTIAGGIALYTIVLAMVDAKKEGDAKKAAALEARRGARRAAKA